MNEGQKTPKDTEFFAVVELVGGVCNLAYLFVGEDHADEFCNKMIEETQADPERAGVWEYYVVGVDDRHVAWPPDPFSPEWDDYMDDYARAIDEGRIPHPHPEEE